MTLRTRTILVLFCDACGWEKELAGSGTLRPRCPNGCADPELERLNAGRFGVPFTEEK